MGFVEGLALLFIGLRLCNVIDWAWVWVLCPIWGGLAWGILWGVIEALAGKDEA